MAEITVLLASEDITDLVLEIGTIARGTDFPLATEMQPSTAQLTLSDPNGDFSPENVNNFFATNGENANGTRCPVEVRADTKLLFAGEVLEVGQNTPRATALLKCIDKTRAIRIEDLTDFGLQKAWKLIQDTQQSAESGVYPIGLGVSPISEGSATLTKAHNQELTVVSEIKTTGILDPDNVQITEHAILSEGGPIDAADGAYPQIRAKTPYRYKNILTLINAILNHYSVAMGNRYMEIPSQTLDLHAETLGRPGYDTVIGALESSQHLNWNGYVTDILRDGNTLYFAYTVNRGQAAFSRILAYETTADTWSTLYTFPESGREVWGLAKIGDNLAMLVTDSRNTSGSGKIPVTGSYDSSQSGNKTKLLYFDVTQSSPSVGVMVDSTATLPAQLATFYQAGSTGAFANTPLANGMLPDTRRRLIVSGSNLYYPYARSNGDFGVARVAIGGSPSAVLTAKSDENRNHAGFAYALSGSTVVFGTTYLDKQESTLKVVKSS